jgi:hypothetical protein
MDLMTRKTIVPALALIAGFAVGGGSVEYIHQRNDQQSKQAFDQKLRCKALADAYIRTQNKDETALSNIDEVGYSQSTNTCFAAVHEYETFGQATWVEYSLIDLTSGKIDSIGSCDENRDCGNGRDMKLSSELSDDFKQAIEGKDAATKKAAKP